MMKFTKLKWSSATNVGLFQIKKNSVVNVATIQKNAHAYSVYLLIFIGYTIKTFSSLQFKKLKFGRIFKIKFAILQNDAQASKLLDGLNSTLL